MLGSAGVKLHLDSLLLLIVVTAVFPPFAASQLLMLLLLITSDCVTAPPSVASRCDSCHAFFFESTNVPLGYSALRSTVNKCFVCRFRSISVRPVRLINNTCRPLWGRPVFMCSWHSLQCLATASDLKLPPPLHQPTQILRPRRALRSCSLA